MSLFNKTIAGTTYTFTKHFHIGIPYYCIHDGETIVLVPHNDTWCFLNPESVPAQIKEIEQELVAAISEHEKVAKQGD
jgi:hypothetical protein